MGDLFPREAPATEFGYHLADSLAEHLQSCLLLSSVHGYVVGCCDPCCATVRDVEQPLLGKETIGLCDCVEMDAELQGQLADRRKWLRSLKRPLDN